MLDEIIHKSVEIGCPEKLLDVASADAGGGLPPVPRLLPAPRDAAQVAAGGGGEQRRVCVPARLRDLQQEEATESKCESKGSSLSSL